MIPNIFVSSTVEDLHHLRDAIRDAIGELSYAPVMSEYGDIGYLPSASAEESCYKTVRDCHIAVIMIGKRYGTIAQNGLSITHNEFRTARDNKIPVVCLVDNEALTFKRIYDANSKTKQPGTFPGMKDPQKTFAFIQEITDSAVNNGILRFSNVSEAREHLKKQLAHIFGDLLRSRFDPLKAEVRDVLAEIRTLRHELLENKGVNPRPYLKTIRFFLDDENERYVTLIAHVSRDIETAVPVILKSKTFSEFIKKVGVELEIKKTVPEVKHARDSEVVKGTEYYYAESILPPNGGSGLAGACFIVPGKKVIMDENQKEYFDNTHSRLQQLLTSESTNQ